MFESIWTKFFGPSYVTPSKSEKDYKIVVQNLKLVLKRKVEELNDKNKALEEIFSLLDGDYSDCSPDSDSIISDFDSLLEQRIENEIEDNNNNKLDLDELKSALNTVYEMLGEAQSNLDGAIDDVGYAIRN